MCFALETVSNEVLFLEIIHDSILRFHIKLNQKNKAIAVRYTGVYIAPNTFQTKVLLKVEEQYINHLFFKIYVVKKPI